MSKDRIIKDVIKAAGSKNVIVITAQDFKDILAAIAEFALPRYIIDQENIELVNCIKTAKPGTMIEVDKHNIPLIKNLNKVEMKKEVKKEEAKKDETGQK